MVVMSMTMMMTVIGLPFLQFVSANPSVMQIAVVCDQWLRNVLSFQVLLTEGIFQRHFPSKILTNKKPTTLQEINISP